jgi:hypothetical protein
MGSPFTPGVAVASGGMRERTLAGPNGSGCTVRSRSAPRFECGHGASPDARARRGPPRWTWPNGLGNRDTGGRGARLPSAHCASKTAAVTQTRSVPPAAANADLTTGDETISDEYVGIAEWTNGVWLQVMQEGTESNTSSALRCVNRMIDRTRWAPRSCGSALVRTYDSSAMSSARGRGAAPVAHLPLRRGGSGAEGRVLHQAHVERSEAAHPARRAIDGT